LLQIGYLAVNIGFQDSFVRGVGVDMGKGAKSG
jgi:hypothetical protein